MLKTWDFVEDPNEEFKKSKVLGLGSVHEASWSFFYAPRGTNSSYLGLLSIFGLEIVDVRVVIRCPSPKRSMLRLGEDKGLPQEERSLRLGKGCVRLSEGMFA